MLKYLLITIILFYSSIVNAFECTKNIDEMSSQYHVKIYCKLNSFYFMSLNVSGDQANQDILEGSETSLHKFLSTYPQNFLDKNIKEIVLLTELKYQGSRVGGLSNGESIYLSIQNHTNYQGFRDRVYITALHHELSSSIYKKASWKNTNSWKNITYSYIYSRSYLIKCLENSEYSRFYNKDLLQDGFLNNYSLTNDENDFNVYAEKLFTGDKELHSNTQTYNKVKIKVQLLKGIYRELGFSGRFPDES